LRGAALIAAVLALAACDTPIGTEVARASAKSVVNDVVQTRFPGAPVEPVTDCIIDQASGNEIISIAGDAVRGSPSPGTIELVIDIATRPDTVQCFISEAGPAVLPSLIGLGLSG
jgi:hypothetical protein